MEQIRCHRGSFESRARAKLVVRRGEFIQVVLDAAARVFAREDFVAYSHMVAQMVSVVAGFVGVVLDIVRSGAGMFDPLAEFF